MLFRSALLRHSILSAVLTTGVLLALPTPAAQARVPVGVGVGVPFFAPVYPFYPFYAPRVIYAPTVVYAPPPVVYAPPAYAAAPSLGRCFAGAYVCRWTGLGRSGRLVLVPPTLGTLRDGRADSPRHI